MGFALTSRTTAFLADKKLRGRSLSSDNETFLRLAFLHNSFVIVETIMFAENLCWASNFDKLAEDLSLTSLQCKLLSGSLLLGFLNVFVKLLIITAPSVLFSSMQLGPAELLMSA